jgi:hypothetical protein
VEEDEVCIPNTDTNDNKKVCSPNTDPDGDDFMHVVSKITKKGLLDITCCRKISDDIYDSIVMIIAHSSLPLL